MAVEASYKAGFGFMDPSQSDFDDMELTKKALDDTRASSQQRPISDTYELLKAQAFNES